MSQYQALIEKHQETLSQALNAVHTREFYAHWAEAPSGKIYGENANAEGLQAFQQQLNQPFTRLLQSGSEQYGEEESPYGFALDIRYPISSAEELVSRAAEAQEQWKALALAERAAILIECLEQATKHFFEIAYATQHTTGQGFVMAFQASGPHSYDRALEAVATGYHALSSFSTGQTWTKPMGKMNVTLTKKFHAVPKGINVTIGCSTFPIWNNVPGMFASLITGAATIAKAHPKAVYPIAILVASMQQSLQSLGINPHLVQVAVPSPQHPLTLELVQHPAVGTVDYTGSSAFGTQIEKLCAEQGKVCFSEKAGVNCVIVESAKNLDAVLDNLAFSVSLYSGQMCTAPQNFFIPRDGVSDGEGDSQTVVSFDEVAQRFAQKVSDIANNEKMGASTLGAIQNAATAERVEKAAASGAVVLRAATTVAQPGFENARSLSPLVLTTSAEAKDLYEQEWFGPVAFLIPTESFEQAVQIVRDSVRQHGALTTSCYTTDAAKQAMAEEALIAAGAPVAFNFVGPIWINQSAAFSDFHGAGANPAGNASFADLSFVAARYNVIGTRIMG